MGGTGLNVSFYCIREKKAPGKIPSKEFDLIFFIPTYAMGGAEIVNANIISCFPDKKICIFFTKKSENNAMSSHFKLPNADLHDISKWTDNKKKYWQSFIWRGKCSKLINTQSVNRLYLTANVILLINFTLD